MLSVLKYWRKAGLDQHKAQAFTSLQLQDQSQAQSAVYLLVLQPHLETIDSALVMDPPGAGLVAATPA